jgi:hypothetical protein
MLFFQPKMEEQIMGLREKFEDRIKRKEQEIQEYESLIREARAYLQALQDAMKILPREEARGSVISTGSKSDHVIRRGSNMDKARELLKKVGKPLYIEEILLGIGKSTSKADRSAIAGALSWYVRRDLVFTRPSPGTYGLKEMHIDLGESALDLWDRIRDEIKKSGKMPLAAKMKVAAPKDLKDNVLTVSESSLPFKPDELEAIRGAAESLGGFKVKIANGSSEDEPPANFGIDFNDAEPQAEFKE